MRANSITAAAIAFVLRLWPTTALAEEPPAWSRSFESIREAASKVRSVQARFSQFKELKILAKPLVAQGRFAFQAPDSIRWEYLRPIRSVLLMHRGALKRFTQRKGRLVSDAAERVEALRVVIEEVRGWLAGRFEDSKTFTASLKPGSPMRVELEPQDSAMKELIQRIEVTLGDRPGVLRAIHIVETADASTRIEFHQVELNRPVDEASFREP